MIERKVLVPSLMGFAAAVLALLIAFGVDLTADQQKAILGVVVAALPLGQFILGYLAPHTARPDLNGERDDGA